MFYRMKEGMQDAVGKGDFRRMENTTAKRRNCNSLIISCCRLSIIHCHSPRRTEVVPLQCFAMLEFLVPTLDQNVLSGS